MSENDENSFPWQRQLSDSNPMFAAVINAGRPASWRKNGEDRSRSLLFEQIGAEGVVAYKAEAVLALRVTRGRYGWCHPTEDKISYIFFSQDHVRISRRFGATVKKTKFQKTKVGCHSNVA